MLSEGALKLFLAYAADASNWSGSPLVGGNVEHGLPENGYLTALKKAGLLTTFVDERLPWINFTEAGVSLAAQHGIKVSK
jgi:hypothetical protein